jgi:hypothetical protein
MTTAEKWIEAFKKAWDAHATGPELLAVTRQAWDEAVTVKKSWETYTMTFADGSRMRSGMVEFLPKKTKSAPKPPSAKFAITYVGRDWDGDPLSKTVTEKWDAGMDADDVRDAIMDDAANGCFYREFMEEIDSVTAVRL